MTVTSEPDGQITRSRTELADRFKLPDSHATNRVFLTSVKSKPAMAESPWGAMVSEG